MKPAQFIRSNILITFLSIISLGINFISQIVLAYYYGARYERDAYFSAMVVPTYIIALFAGSFTVVLLPFFVGFKEKSNDDGVRKFISSNFGLIVFGLFIIAIFGFCISDIIVPLIAPGYNLEQISAIRDLFNILIFTIVFQSISSFLIVFYHVENRFFWPALAPMIVPVISLLSVITFNGYGIKSLAYGTLAGSILNVIILFPILKGKIRLDYFFQIINPDTKKIIKLALPLFIFGGIYRVTIIVERIIASNLPSGSISYLGYGNQIYLLLCTLVAGSIVTTLYPILSRVWVDGNKVELYSYMCKGINLILMITLPIASIFIALAKPIIEILFQRGAFDSNSTIAVAHTLIILMGAFIFSSTGNIIAKIFYITNKTVLISAVSIAEVLIYILSGYFLSLKYSYLGLAAALTISTGFSVVVLLIILHNEALINYFKLFRDFIKLIFASIICGIIAYFLYCSLALIATLLALVLSISVAIVFYAIVVLYIYKIDDAISFQKTLKNYFKFNKASF